MTDKFDVIVVGGGPSGLAAAYIAAKAGLNTFVAERGDSSGTKNMFGGVLYVDTLRKLIPEFWKEAPVERPISQRKITFLTDESYVSIDYKNQKFREPPYNGFSVLRAKFDKWFSQKAEEAGALIAAGIKVDDLVYDGQKITGIKSESDMIEGNVIIAADGVVSLMSQKAGLKPQLKPSDVGLGVKEVIELPEGEVDKRFGLKKGEGVEELILGAPTRKLRGGGFVYTNKTSISLGLIVSLEEMRKSEYYAYDMIENFRANPYISDLVEGGTIKEYSAHLIPERGLGMVPKLYRDGMMVVGDAAGFVNSSGIYLNGVDLAILSGVFAAQTAIKAHKDKDFSAKSMMHYETLLKESVILKDMQTYKKAPKAIENPRFYSKYPDMINNIMKNIVISDGLPKKRIMQLLKQENMPLTTLLIDAIKGGRAL
jgi:electron transfer flavoprotein-quinone oxidoreductase